MMNGRNIRMLNAEKYKYEIIEEYQNLLKKILSMAMATG